MRTRLSRFAAFAAAMSLAFTPAIAQANTRAPATTVYAQSGGNGTGSALAQGETRRKNRDWLLVLFGSVAALGAIAALLASGSGNNQSNGAN